ARASAISLTGIMAFAPLCSAVTNVLVARSTSNTTQVASRKSRLASAGNSAGVKMASIFILSRAKLFHFRSHVMEKILLGVAGVWPEMGHGKMPEPFVADPAAWEI